MSSTFAFSPSIGRLRGGQLDLGGFYRRHAWIIPWMAAVLLLDFWVITWGDGRLLQPEAFSNFYDAQARALLHGRLDVPYEAIGFEAFVRDGKFYGYFGIAPALLRVPLVLLFPKMDGCWSRLLMLIACAGNVLLAYRILLRTRGAQAPLSRPLKFAAAAMIVLAGAGSTTLFIATRSYVFHEAIMWGSLWTLLCLDALVGYLAEPTPGRLKAAAVAAFMAFNTRPTAGAGALLAMCCVAGMLAWRMLRKQPGFNAALAVSAAEERGLTTDITDITDKTNPFNCLLHFIRDIRDIRGQKSCRAERESRDSFEEGSGSSGGAAACRRGEMFLAPMDRPGRHLRIAAAGILLTLGVYFAVNYGRFRTFDGVPLKYYSVYLIHNPAAAAGKQIHLENFPTGLANYFSFAGIALRGTFPWIFISIGPSLVGHPTIECVEPFGGMPVAMPGLFFLALAGTVPLLRGGPLVRRRHALAAACALAGGLLVTLTIGITHRYLHDFFPFLIIAAMAGCQRLIESPCRRRNLAVLTALVLASVYINLAFAMQFQRSIVWGVAGEKRTQYVNVRAAIDRTLGAATPANVRGLECGAPAAK